MLLGADVQDAGGTHNPRESGCIVRAYAMGGLRVTVWEEIRDALLSSGRTWLTGGEIASRVRMVNSARSAATVRASVSFYCVNDRSKNSSAGHVYWSNPLLITDDPLLRGKNYRLLSELERAAFLAHPRADLELLGYEELLEWLGSPSGTDALPRPTSAVVTASEQNRAAEWVAEAITRDFSAGTLDLTGRAGAPKPGWESMPEFGAVRRWLAGGATGAEIRTLLTVVAALDRARDADRLWHSAARLFEEQRWAFDLASVKSRSLHDLKDVLAEYGVSQRHLADSGAWRLILESLGDPLSPRSLSV